MPYFIAYALIVHSENTHADPVLYGLWGPHLLYILHTISKLAVVLRNV